MLWVRGFRGHTDSGRRINLTKPFRRHFQPTIQPFPAAIGAASRLPVDFPHRLFAQPFEQRKLMRPFLSVSGFGKVEAIFLQKGGAEAHPSAVEAHFMRNGSEKKTFPFPSIPGTDSRVIKTLRPEGLEFFLFPPFLPTTAGPVPIIPKTSLGLVALQNRDPLWPPAWAACSIPASCPFRASRLLEHNMNT